MSARRPLQFDTLEDRAVPALFGNPWPSPDRLTVSFVPDGTDVAGSQSTLNQTLGTRMSAATWQQEAIRAFQTWAQPANLNFTVVGDNGKPFGEAGPIQGSTWFGDIRISARPLSDNVLAVSTPFNLFDSWSGEIVLNSNKTFGKGAAAGQYDLYTVLVQEAGHALGLDNSPDTGSVMFTTYSSPRTGLAASDVAAIQKLYGVRVADAFDAKGSNDTLAAADSIGFVVSAGQLNGTDGTGGKTPLVAAGDITTLTDVDTYAYKVPKGQTEFKVALLTEGISQLRAKVTVYDAAGKVVVSTVAAPAPGKPFELTVTGAKADATYRVMVEGATKDVFGVGGYRLAVGADPAAAVVPPPVTGYVNNDYNTDDTRDKAWNFGDARPSTDARWDFTGTASIVNVAKADVDWFKVHTKADTPRVAVAVVSALDATALRPSVEVYDKDGVRLAVEVLSNTGGTIVIQLTNVRPDTDYFLRVAAANPTSKGQGNYFVAVDFRDKAVTLPTFAAGTFQGTAKQAVTTFGVKRTQQVYFEVAGTGSPDVAVRMTVYDANNVAILTLTAKGGEVSGKDILLAPGVYTVRFVAAAKDGGALPAFQFRGRYTLVSDPIGPELIDPTGDPFGAFFPTPVATGGPVLYGYDTAEATFVPFLAPSTVYTAPVGVAPTEPVVWFAPPPPPTFFAATDGDLFSNPWW